MAALSIGSGVADDELEAFRREWRAEVEAKKEVEVDAGGVKWKGSEKEGKKEAREDKGKGKAKAKAKDEAEEWPDEPALKAVRSRSPTKARPRSPAKAPASPKQALRSPTKAQFPKPAARSPTKASAQLPRSPTKPAHAAKPTRAAELAADTPTDSDSDSTMPFPQRRRTGDAVGLYTRAVEAEQGGRLSDALHLYRRAFRADENVDRLYALSVRKADAERAREAELQAELPPSHPEKEPTTVDIVDPTAPEEPEYKFTREVQVHPDYEREGGRVSRLTALLEARRGDPESFPEGEAGDPALSFRAADAALPLPLAGLPAELLDRVLLFLDVAALETFGVACWRARLLTAHSAAWKRLAERIYAPPMVESAALGRSLARRHRDEWRTTLVEEERLRMDGAYISVCHYIRPGAGEQWVTITHMSELSGAGALTQSRTTASCGSTRTGTSSRSSRPTTRPRSCRCSSRRCAPRACTLAGGGSCAPKTSAGASGPACSSPTSSSLAAAQSTSLRWSSRCARRGAGGGTSSTSCPTRPSTLPRARRWV
jgi:F-box protein 9